MVEETEFAFASTTISPAVLPRYSREFCGLIIIEFGVCGRLIAVPSVVPVMGKSCVWVVPVLGDVVQVRVGSAGTGNGSVQVTNAVAVVLGVPVTVPLTRLLVTFALVPILQLFGRHDAEMPTAPTATPLTVPVLLTVATEGWGVFQFSVGNVVSGVLVLSVVVTDSTNTPLTTLPTLNWNTPQPSVATVNSTGTVSGVAVGAVGISASCLPNNCNIGTSANVTSNLVSGTVTGTPSTTATAFVTCTDPLPVPADPTRTCTTSPSTGTTQTQLFPITGTTLGTAINLPHTPNSMMINPQNSRLYLGSTAGLMVVDANANSVSSTITNAPGTILTVAPNGNAVVVSNGADAFLYNGSTVQTLLNGATHIVGATAAAFSPDSCKLIITTSSGQVWFEVAGNTPTFNTDGSFISAAFLPSGSLQAVSRPGVTNTYGLGNAGSPTNPLGCGGLMQPLPNVDAMY